MLNMNEKNQVSETEMIKREKNLKMKALIWAIFAVYHGGLTAIMLILGRVLKSNLLIAGSMGILVIGLWVCVKELWNIRNSTKVPRRYRKILCLSVEVDTVIAIFTFVLL